MNGRVSRHSYSFIYEATFQQAVLRLIFSFRKDLVHSICSFAAVRTFRRTTLDMTQVPQVNGHETMNKVTTKDETRDLRVLVCENDPITTRALRVSNDVRSKAETIVRL